MAPEPSTSDDFIAVDVYATYPHCNGFLPDGSRMVVGDAERPALHIVDVERGARPELLVDLPPAGDAIAWFDVALEVPLLAMAWAGRVLTLDLTDAAARPRTVHTGDLDGLVGISPDGSRIAAIEQRGTERTLLVIDAETGRVDDRVSLASHANHVQMSPADPSWIGCAHEGAAADIADRVRAHHPASAPAGRLLFDQRANADDPAHPLQVGHERWMFHRTGAVLVAYGDGPQTRGVWEAPVDAPARLVSAGERDWHVGISRDGSRVVVDTTGPADMPGHGWQDAGDRSSIIVIDTGTGARTVVAETRFAQHPFHPHPSFTPDGRAVVHNHIDATGRRGVALREVPR